MSTHATIRASGLGEIRSPRMAAHETASKKISGQTGGSGRHSGEIEEAKTCICRYFSSALGRTRTCDPLIRRPNRAVLCGSPKRAKGDFPALLVLRSIGLFCPVP